MRTEKGTRLRGLPAKIRLLELDAVPVHPTIHRTSSDNRTGKFFEPFDDTRSLVFGTASVVLSVGLPSGSRYLTSELTTALSASSVVVPGIGDSWILRHTGGFQPLLPFVDNAEPAADGIAHAPSSQTFQFYMTGSRVTDVGPGFQQPLSAKTKVVFDLTPATNHSFGITNFTSGTSSHPMAFFNKSSRTWVGVGSGAEPITYVGTNLLTSGSMESMFEMVAVGFGSNYSDAIATGLTSGAFAIGSPISNFGFPTHDKFSGSNTTTWLMSDYISEPFLVEKVVVMFSGAFARDGIFVNNTLSTFFVLNERNSQPLHVATQSISIVSGSAAFPPNAVVTFSTSSVATKSRDLVTWMQIAANVNGPVSATDEFATNFKTGRELVLSDAEWSGQFMVSGTVKTPIGYDKSVLMRITRGTAHNEYYETWTESGRNQTKDTGRNWLNATQTPERYGSVSQFSDRGGAGAQLSVNTNKQYSKTNPYLLFPTDRLIFGWQVPTPMRGWVYAGPADFQNPVFVGTTGPHLSFATGGVHKVILYGSLLRVGPDGNLVEHHDTLNQLVVTEAVGG